MPRKNGCGGCCFSFYYIILCKTLAEGAVPVYFIRLYTLGRFHWLQLNDVLFVSDAFGVLICKAMLINVSEKFHEGWVMYTTRHII